MTTKNTLVSEVANWIEVGCLPESVPSHYETTKLLRHTPTRRHPMGRSMFTDGELSAMRQFEHRRAEAYAKRVAGTPEKREEAMRQIAQSLKGEGE